MSKPQPQNVVQAVLDRYGRTFCDELHIHVEHNTPAPLFRLLVFSLLSSTRISYQAAVSAARALFKAGWTTPRKMAAATWAQRVKVLNRSGYARYDESTSRMLADTCELLLDRYGGDLRKLREQAGRDPARERELLKECKGIGDVGVNIFFREAQTAWDELFPFMDDRVRKTAGQLGLPSDPQRLLELVGREDFLRLVTGLIRVQLEHDAKAVLKAAG